MIDGSPKMCRVGVLLKLHYLLPTEGKEVCELRSDTLPGLFIDAAVITAPDDGVAGVKGFFGRAHTTSKPDKVTIKSLLSRRPLDRLVT